MNYKELLKSNPRIFNNEGALLKIVTDINVINSWVEDKKKELSADNLPGVWGEIGIVFEDPYIIVLRDLVVFPDGKLGSHLRILNSADVKGGQAIVVLPIIDGKILILRQFRHPTREWHWEFPRGFGEPNTSPEDNAKNELLEEIGAEVLELKDLGIYHSNTGFIGSSVRLYLAKLKSTGHPNQNEGIESYSLFDAKKIEKMIRESEITDGYTIAAFTRAKFKRLV